MKLVYALHMMWYEHGLLKEHFDSIRHAIKHTNLPVKLIVCANLQTYIETPDNPELLHSFMEAVNVELKDFKDVELVVKDNSNPFYNIGDFRRDVRNQTGYTIWGELDCVIPKTYFGILESLMNDDLFQQPHVVTLASRKMWDNTWTPVEHTTIQFTSFEELEHPLRNNDYITQDELDTFNEQFDPAIAIISETKLDGALVALHPHLPLLIPYDMHFAREDYIAQVVLRMHGIPQYHLATVLKGHNYAHPQKRKNTKSSRAEDIYKKYEKESFEAGMNYIKKLGGYNG